MMQDIVEIYNFFLPKSQLSTFSFMNATHSLNDLGYPVLTQCCARGLIWVLDTFVLKSILILANQSMLLAVNAFYLLILSICSKIVSSFAKCELALWEYS